MARKLFERQAVRRRSGALAAGVALVVYTDEAATVLADVSLTSGGSAIAGSTVTTANIAGLGPASLRFWGPTDGTDTLYLRTPSDTSLGIQKLEAATDPRLDALEGGSSGIPGTIFDAKGDLIAATAADTAARLAVGANGTVLTAASGQTTGLQWATPAGGGADGADTIDPEAAAYGADGTGATDSAAALEAAFAAALTLDQAVVARPGRIFRVDSTVDLDEDGITVDFRGSTIKKAAALTTYAVDVSGDDITLRNAVIDGNRAGGATGSNVLWSGARGKAVDCISKASTLRGWVASGAGATLDAVRCAGNDHVSAASGMGSGQGWYVGEGALLRQFNCEGNDNDYVGVFLTSTSADGCRVEGEFHRNAHAGARIEGADKGTMPWFYSNGCNRYGLLMISAPDRWQIGTVKIRNAGAAIAAFDLPADGSGACVQLFGNTNCTIDTVDGADGESYGLALGNDGANGATRNLIGTVLTRAITDPALLFSTSANHNEVGTLICEGSTYALNFGEGSDSADHNSIGTVFADNCTYGAIKVDDGNYNHIGRLIARNIQTFDTVTIGKGVVQFGNLGTPIAIQGNTIGWLEHQTDSALGSPAPQYLVHATASATGNRVEGGIAHQGQAGVYLDDANQNIIRLADPATGRYFSFEPGQVEGLRMWLAADRIYGVADTAAVTTWTDGGGYGVDFTQATSGNRPTFQANEANGYPAVRFDGTDDWLETTHSFLGSTLFAADEATFVVVMKQDSTQATGNSILDWLATDGTNRFSVFATYSDVLYFRHGDAASGAQLTGAQPGGWDNAWHVVTCRLLPDGTVNIYVDGTSITSGTFTDSLGITVSAVLTLGAATSGHTDLFKGDLAELLLYNRGLPTPQRQQLERWLGGKYGITVA